MLSLFERQERTLPVNPWRTAEYALLAIGFLCLGIYGYTWVEGHLYQSYEEYRLESAVKGREGSLLGYARWAWSGGDPGPQTSGEDDDAYQSLAKPAPGPKPVPADGLIGRIEVPRLNVTAIVREGVDSKTLRRAAGHVPGTALPGDDGNVALAAHRDTYFRGLRDVKPDDLIRVTTREGTYEYVVRGTQIVKPENVEVLDPQRKREMTLITCYPFNYIGHAPNRFIVRAEQVAGPGFQPPPASAVPAVAAPPPAAAPVKKAVAKSKGKPKVKLAKRSTHNRRR